MSSLISAPDFLTLQALCNRLNLEVEVGAEKTFEFDESDQIRLDIPEDGTEREGWSIIPLVLPLVVRMHASLQNESKIPMDYVIILLHSCYVQLLHI